MLFVVWKSQRAFVTEKIIHKRFAFICTLLQPCVDHRHSERRLILPGIIYSHPVTQQEPVQNEPRAYILYEPAETMVS
jgi:hypothetical protein